MTSRTRLLRALRLALFALIVASPPVFPQSANELLARLIGEEDARRGTARVAILRSHDRSLIPALVDALFFAPAAARTDVVTCLEGLAGVKLGPHYRYWVEWVGGHGEI
ncbi:MAG: hypothetical protein M3R34_06600, partial [Acidobacteriota bacterium]|nr:hypothetical protein [Acidobacteriota bacterium]